MSVLVTLQSDDIVVAHLTTDSSSTDATSYTTASISPAPNALILAAVWNGATGVNPTPTLTGNGLTWVLVDQAAYDVSGTFGILHVFRAMGASPSAGTLLIDFGAQTVLACGWSISQFTNVDTSGTNGSGAIVQSVDAIGLGNAADVTLAAFSSVENSTYGALAHQTNNVETLGAGFSLLGRSTTTTPVTTISTFWQVPNDTSVDADWTTATEKWGIIGVELKQAVAAGAHTSTATWDQGPASWAATATESFLSTATYVQSVAAWQASASEAFPSSATWLQAPATWAAVASEAFAATGSFVQATAAWAAIAAETFASTATWDQAAASWDASATTGVASFAGTWDQVAAAWDASATVAAAGHTSTATWDQAAATWDASAGYVPCDEFTGQLGTAGSMPGALLLGSESDCNPVIPPVEEGGTGGKFGLRVLVRRSTPPVREVLPEPVAMMASFAQRPAGWKADMETFDDASWLVLFDEPALIGAR